MKKALIKLIEKWAYRCEHKWKKVTKDKVYDPTTIGDLPHTIRYLYRCTKCCEQKTIQ
jgi:hypothetical protein